MSSKEADDDVVAYDEAVQPQQRMRMRPLTDVHPAVVCGGASLRPLQQAECLRADNACNKQRRVCVGAGLTARVISVEGQLSWPRHKATEEFRLHKMCNRGGGHVCHVQRSSPGCPTLDATDRLGSTFTSGVSDQVSDLLPLWTWEVVAPTRSQNGMSCWIMKGCLKYCQSTAD